MSFLYQKLGRVDLSVIWGEGNVLENFKIIRDNGF